jgi:hypothetical protein
MDCVLGSAGVTAVPDRAETPIRRLSKRLFGSQYRLEVATAALTLGASWTTFDLDAVLPDAGDLPRSCVNKELNGLLALGLIERARDLDGRARFRYSVGNTLPEFWSLVRALATREREPERPPATVHVLPTSSR